MFVHQPLSTAQVDTVSPRAGFVRAGLGLLSSPEKPYLEVQRYLGLGGVTGGCCGQGMNIIGSGRKCPSHVQVCLPLKPSGPLTHRHPTIFLLICLLSGFTFQFWIRNSMLLPILSHGLSYLTYCASCKSCYLSLCEKHGLQSHIDWSKNLCDLGDTLNFSVPHLQNGSNDSTYLIELLRIKSQHTPSLITVPDRE